MANTTFDESGQALSSADDAFVGPVLGPLIDDQAYVGDELIGYAEYGVVDHVEVFGSLPLKYSRVNWNLATDLMSPVQHTSIGPGDLSGGVRAGIKEGGFAGSAALAVRLPLYDVRPQALNQGPGNADFFDDKVPQGEGTVDVELPLGLGYGGGLGWVQFEGAPRVRSGGYSIVTSGRFQAGIKPISQVAVFGAVDGRTFLPTGTREFVFRDEFDKGPTIIDRVKSLSAGGGLLIKPLDDEPYGGIVEATTMLMGARASKTSAFQLSFFMEL